MENLNRRSIDGGKNVSSSTDRSGKGVGKSDGIQDLGSSHKGDVMQTQRHIKRQLAPKAVPSAAKIIQGLTGITDQERGTIDQTQVAEAIGRWVRELPSQNPEEAKKTLRPKLEDVTPALSANVINQILDKVV